MSYSADAIKGCEMHKIILKHGLKLLIKLKNETTNVCNLKMLENNIAKLNEQITKLEIVETNLKKELEC